MSRRKLWLLFVLSALTLCSFVFAQEPGPHPGIIYQGKFIGYVPPHLRNNVRPGSLPANLASNAISRPDFGVQPVDYVEEVPPLDSDATYLGESEIGDLSPQILDSTCDGCPQYRSCLLPLFWGRGEFLFWWTKPQNVPALATTSTAGTPAAQAGVLGLPTTTVVFGNGGLNDNGDLGGRATLGLWLDVGRSRGFDATYMFVPTENNSFAASNATFPILARPFFNVVTGLQDARRIVFPGEIQGNLTIDSTSELHSFEFLYRWTTLMTPCQRTHLLVGYRFAKLDDRIRIDENTLALAAPLAGATFNVFDEFSTQNTFNGVEAGIEAEWIFRSRWSLEASGKVAVGETNAQANIAGQVVTTIGGVPAVARGGLLALPTNIGTFHQNEINALGELGLTLRRHVNRNLTGTIGYSCMMWSSVARAGDQIDVGINTTQVPPGVLAGAARPSFAFDMSSYWAQGLRVGVEYAY